MRGFIRANPFNAQLMIKRGIQQLSMRWNLQTRLLNTSLILAADMEPVEILKSLHNPKNAQVSPYLDMYGVNRWQTFLL